MSQKNEKQIMVDKVSHRKLKAAQHKFHSNKGEGETDPAPLVAHVELLLLQIWC
jgi:hypothetical protein